jgi:hypothetical protein
MIRGEKSDISSLSSFSTEIDSFGYYSMLLTYHSTLPDNLIKSARVLSENEKIKYMIAIRTYAISPEYMSMICKSFNEISKNRLMLNIVSGDIHADENPIDDIVMIENMIDTPEKRLDYTDSWMNKFLKIKNFKDKPEIVMSGHSDITRLMAIKYNSTHLSMYDMYKDYINTENPIINSKQMISLCFVVRKTQEEADLFFESLDRGKKLWTICGDKEKIKSFIYKLESEGVTDLLISGNPEDDQKILVHNMVKEIIEEQNGIK